MAAHVCFKGSLSPRPACPPAAPPERPSGQPRDRETGSRAQVRRRSRAKRGAWTSRRWLCALPAAPAPIWHPPTPSAPEPRRSGGGGGEKTRIPPAQWHQAHLARVQCAHGQRLSSSPPWLLVLPELGRVREGDWGGVHAARGCQRRVRQQRPCERRSAGATGCVPVLCTSPGAARGGQGVVLGARACKSSWGEQHLAPRSARCPGEARPSGRCSRVCITLPSSPVHLFPASCGMRVCAGVGAAHRAQRALARACRPNCAAPQWARCLRGALAAPTVHALRMWPPLAPAHHPLPAPSVTVPPARMDVGAAHHPPTADSRLLPHTPPPPPLPAPQHSPPSARGGC